MTTQPSLDTSDLEKRIKDMYDLVANSPHLQFHFETGRPLAEQLGYPVPDLDACPADAIASFAGVGYFFDLAYLQPGESVLDLGSGSGTDSFIAAGAVGPDGSVVGVDITAAQLAKATRLAEAAGISNVEFRNGYIERPPVEPSSVDCVISNGVVNLAPDKTAVFRAAAESLRPGGRLAIADIVSSTQMPETITCDASLWAACIGGAALLEDYLAAIRDAGFEIRTIRENDYRFISDRAVSATTKYGVTSISILAALP